MITKFGVGGGQICAGNFRKLTTFIAFPDEVAVSNRHTFPMPQDATLKDVAIQFIKTSVDHRGNRCEKCGRRLKLEPGAILFSVVQMGRFTTCRSCGYENPTLWEKVGEDLINAGFTIPSIEENITDLGACLGCGVELQVSKDFTKVFCNRCGREWDRFEFEDIKEGPLSPLLAGKNAFKIDSSKTAKALEDLLDGDNIESGDPYLVIKLREKQPYESMSFGKGMFAAIKAGAQDEKERQKSGKKKIEESFYLALYDDYTAFYAYKDGVLTISDCNYQELFSAPGDELNLPFSLDNYVSSSIGEYFDLLGRFEVIFKANLSPYKKELYGTALKNAESNGENTKQTSLVDELKKLAELKDAGLLTEEEFSAAKAALINK